ncbi:hypothetical protein [Agromyces aerolatus]|uniref:hypothetical protein n=1 Tax=Agromyces sp. LY-1074 TaxID=3074080 RepID=UPI00285C5D10|nr:MULTISPECIES: hypothetical protein [unclassified Agromyces]MDR5701126.1 hypothetical protein [Agromyces sp. LY-1074]MDR5707766.1 hypothetical protein [Agromyces sp. LY-1358]
MPETSRAGRRTRSSRFGERRRALRRRPVVLALSIGVAALCAAGVGFGAYAAIGDGAGPAALGSQIGIKTPGQAGDEVVAEGRADAGDVDGVPVTEPPASGAPPETAPPATAPPTAAPQPSPGPEPSTPPVRDPSDPLSPGYNPHLTPGDPAYVPEEERAAWLGRQELIRQCMNAAGFEYLEWEWWEGGSPMPAGLDAEAEAAWMTALRGPEPAEAAAGEPAGGCEAAAQQAADEGNDAGDPVTAPVPGRDPAAPTERERWLAFQDAVRACMAEQGFVYEYWEYWNPEDQTSGGSPAMPAGLSADERAAWNTAAFGSPDASGAEHPLDGGGCWTTGAEAVDYREFQ